MSIPIKKIEELKNYFNGVMNRANHHADNVNEIVLALIGGVIWQADNFEVKQYGDAPANILWMYVNDKRYCFKFNHMTEMIDCCIGGHNGNVIASFYNQTSIAEVKEFFEKISLT